MYYIFPYDKSTGALYRHPYYGTEQTMSNPPSGYELLVAIADTDATAQAAYQACEDLQPQQYVVQNGALAANPDWPAIQLQSAITAQLASITSGLNATLVGGFTSKSTGHSYVTTTNGQTNMEGDLKRFELDSTLTSVEFYTLDAGWQPHTQAQLQSAFLDGGLWKDCQYAQARTLVQKIQSATTITDIQSIVWQEASY